MESNIEEQLRDKEAVQAENAAQQALITQYEAEVGRCVTAAVAALAPLSLGCDRVCRVVWMSCSMAYGS